MRASPGPSSPPSRPSAPARYNVTEDHRPPASRSPASTATTAALRQHRPPAPAPPPSNLQAGETVRCIYTNHIDHGRVIIEKRLDPNWASGSFSFSRRPRRLRVRPRRDQPHTDLQGRRPRHATPSPRQLARRLHPHRPRLRRRAATRDCTDHRHPHRHHPPPSRRDRPLHLHEPHRPRPRHHREAARPELGVGQLHLQTGDLGASGSHLARTRATHLQGRQPRHATPSPRAPRPPDFTLTGLDCDDERQPATPPTTATRTATIHLQAGETVRCIYTNQIDLRRTAGAGDHREAGAGRPTSRSEPSGNFEQQLLRLDRIHGLIASGTRTCNAVARHLHASARRLAEHRPVRQPRLRRRPTYDIRPAPHRHHPRRGKRDRALRLGQRRRRGRVMIEKQAPADARPGARAARGLQPRLRRLRLAAHDRLRQRADLRPSSPAPTRSPRPPSPATATSSRCAATTQQLHRHRRAHRHHPRRGQRDRPLRLGQRGSLRSGCGDERYPHGRAAGRP